ncbi:MAG: class I SAM-dependent methyltransferase [Phycisphaerales bacterium]|nr:class I SAM-dependent methyltransferase [Phycisphaerales bacterium]
MSLMKAAARRIPGLRRLDARGRLLGLTPSNAVCAEIGVWKGAFTERVLRQRKPASYHLIDPWAFQGDMPDRWYGGAIADGQGYMDAIHDDIQQRFGTLPNVTIHRSPSVEAAAEFDDDYFDWVYIDGDHSYEAVLADLECYAPKVKSGGWLLGDDFLWGGDSLPVKRAVEEFVASGRAEFAQRFDQQFALRRL